MKCRIDKGIPRGWRRHIKAQAKELRLLSARYQDGGMLLVHSPKTPSESIEAFYLHLQKMCLKCGSPGEYHHREMAVLCDHHARPKCKERCVPNSASCVAPPGGRKV